jgi:hypothetical protein
MQALEGGPVRTVGRWVDSEEGEASGRRPGVRQHKIGK